jgi:hypothetical protein
MAFQPFSMFNKKEAKGMKPRLSNKATPSQTPQKSSVGSMLLQPINQLLRTSAKVANAPASRAPITAPSGSSASNKLLKKTAKVSPEQMAATSDTPKGTFDPYSGTYVTGKPPKAPVQSEMTAPEMPSAPEAPMPSGSATAEAPSAVSQALMPQSRELASKAIQDELLRLMTPAERETALAQELADVTGAYNQAIAGEEGLGRGRTVNLVRGRQGKLAEQGALEQQTLADKLAIEQANRQAQLNATQARLQFTQQQEAEQAAQMKPFEFGGNLVRFNPLTGAIETVAEGPREAVKPITLSEGQSLVNPLTGEVLYSLPKSSDPLQQQKQMLEIQKLQQELGNDLASGSLTEKQLSQLQQTPEFKTLNTVNSFNSQLESYISLIEEYGRAGALQPGQRQQLAAAYADLGTAWKEMKNLGALTGPDLELLAKAIPDATAVGFLGVGNLGGVAGSGSRILETLGNTQKNIALDAIKQYNRLVLRDPSYAQSDYVNTYIMPFVQSNAVTPEDIAKAINYPLSEVEQARQAGYDDATLKAFMLTPSFSNDLGTSQNGLGSLSERYESGGNPGAIGYDSTGGYSYGTYQLAHSNAKKFIEQSPYAKNFSGLAFNSPQWRQTWQQVAQQDPQGFGKAQKNYIKQTHFDPQVKKLQEGGINVAKLSPIVLDAIWSTAVQHGPANSIALNALKQAGSDPKKQLQQIYALRWGGGANFRSSTPQVRQSVYNRFFGPQGELNLALSRLNQNAA